MSKVETVEYYGHARNEMLQFIPAGCHTILEIGCGEGLFGNNLKQLTNAEIWGVEINAEAADKAKAKLDRVLKGDFNNCYIDLPGEYFDCIVFNDVLEHFTYPDIILKECKKLLRPEGAIVASIPNVRYIGNLKELIIKKDWKYKKEGGILDYTHFRFFTQKSILRMFKEAGYKIELIKGLPTKMYWVFYIINFLAVFQLSDTRYPQFAVVAKLNG